MSKLFIWILIISSSASGIFIWRQHHAVCNHTLAYRVGQVDKGFGLSEREFLTYIKRAEHMWEASVARDLFRYDPTADFTINLIFDDRQQGTVARQNLTDRLARVEFSHARLAASYQEWQPRYQRALAAYQQAVASYEARLQQYNQQVQAWNQKGGAPQHIYTQLQDEASALDALRQKLDEDRDYIQGIADMLTSMKDREDTIIESYGAQVKTYNERYGKKTRFNQGEYNGKSITIYQFNDPADLTLVLAHELGHALRLEHVDDPQAVMHYLKGDQDLTGLALKLADVEALKTACRLH